MRVLDSVTAAIAVTVSLMSVTEALAQVPSAPPPTQRAPAPGAESPTPGEEKTIEGEVRSVHPSGTELTLTDGTTLSTPPGAAIRPGVLAEGAIVVASYREENGKKILTGLMLKEPATSPPASPGAPGTPRTPPPGESPTRR